MTNYIPEWILQRYSKLWNKFKDKEFTKSEAEKVLADDKTVAVILSKLRKSGWLEMKTDEQDARKSIYKLKSPDKTILDIVKEFK